MEKVRSGNLRLFAVLALAIALAVGTQIMPQAGDETYLVCSDITWPPFEWQDAAGNIYGFDMDAMRLIALVEGYEITIEHRDWALIFDEVGTGRCDIGASGATITAEREKKVDFSDPYWTSDQAILVRVDSGLNIVTALSQGHTVGAQVDT
ncbi:MAG: transporter substrate-binding domain-containing protein, partial [Candidatus Bipolaricaulia bacterium]